MIELGFLIALQAIIGGFDSHMVHQVMRVWCLTASTTVFQTESRGSNPLTRSRFNARLAQLVAAVLLQSTGRKFEPYTEYHTFGRGCDLLHK